MSNIDTKYINLCKEILANGNVKGDRTGTGTISLFGAEIRHDLSEGFPILTTKSVHFKSVVGELLFFLRGDTNIKFLQDHNIKIWDGFANEDGSIGGMYPKLWRDWDGVDQIANLIYGIKNTPNSRRLLVSAWNPSDLPDESVSPIYNVNNGKPALGACHYSFQCYVNNGKLSIIVNMRSSDILLGLSFNLASYALLTHMLAQVCDLEVGELIWRGGDCHIYNNHIEQVKTQIDRYDNGEVFDAPRLVLNKAIMDIDDFTFNDIELVGYQSGSAIKGKVAI